MDYMRRRKQKLIRRPNVIVQDQDEEVFLLDDQENTIHVLNIMGAAIWRMLEKPTSADEVTKMLIQAFPDTPKPRIRADVMHLMRDLYSKQLIDMVKPGATE